MDNLHLLDKAVEFNVRIEDKHGYFYLQIDKKQAITCFKNGMYLTYNQFDMAYFHKDIIPHLPLADNIAYKGVEE